MEKKNKNRFSIMFNDYDPYHEFASEILNSLPARSVAAYVARVIYEYENGNVLVSKRANTAQLTTEKRKRGRPKKTPDLITEQNTEEVIEKVEVQKSESNSSSHSNPPISAEAQIITSDLETPIVENTSEERALPNKISDSMIDSMLGFCG